MPPPRRPETGSRRPERATPFARRPPARRGRGAEDSGPYSFAVRENVHPDNPRGPTIRRAQISPLSDARRHRGGGAFRGGVKSAGPQRCGGNIRPVRRSGSVDGTRRWQRGHPSNRAASLTSRADRQSKLSSLPSRTTARSRSRWRPPEAHRPRLLRHHPCCSNGSAVPAWLHDSTPSPA